jgi:inositol phosphorylceramide mannosyltransferase catalytic subunit
MKNIKKNKKYNYCILNESIALINKTTLLLMIQTTKSNRIQTVQIPKIVHLTWKTRDIPNRWKPAIAGWKRHNPDWKLKLWTDEDNRKYIADNHPYFLQTYDSFPYNIQRADAIRYFLLQDFGGLYSDLDILPIAPIEPFLRGCFADALLCHSGNVNTLTNSFMGSPPKSPFWKYVIREMMSPSIPWFAQTKHFIVMYSTGPLMLDRVYRSYKRPIVLLPRSVFMAYSIDDHHLPNFPNTVFRPLQGGSWNEWDSMVLNFLFRCWNQPLRSTFIVTILVFLVLLIRRNRFSQQNHIKILKNSK